MSRASHGVHRCPSCDELAEADFGPDGMVTCLKCGHVLERKVPPSRKRTAGSLDLGGSGLVQRNVASRRHLDKAALPEPAPIPKAKTPEISISKDLSYRQREEVISEDEERKVVRRRKRRRKLPLSRIVVFLIWLGAVVLTVTLVKKKMKGRGGVVGGPEPGANVRKEERLNEEARAYVQKQMEECRGVLGGFLEAPDAAARAQYVSNGPRLAAEMTTHYRQNTAFRPGGALAPARKHLILRENARAIETSWNSEGSDRVEVVFVREARQWKIDWEAFVRYSTIPWHLFVSEVGGSEGTFRVYLRIKESSVSEEGEEVLSLRFYPPLQDQRLRSRGSSPAVLVPARSESGLRIQEISQLKERKLAVGDRRIYRDDPKGLHRVRVALEWRAGTDGKRYMHLTEVLAGNWLGEWYEEDFAEASREPEVARGTGAP